METGAALLSLIIVAAGAFSSRLGRANITFPMVFVGAGLLLGPPGVGVLTIHAEAEWAKHLTELTLALLLFADASTLNIHRIRQDAGLPTRLLVIALPLIMILGAVAAAILWPGYNLALAALLATILAPTDAALGLPIFENPKVPARIRRALNVESGLNDGIATPFVTLAIAFAAASEAGTEHWVLNAVSEMGIGALVGIAAGAVGARLLAAANDRSWTTASSTRLAVLGLTGVAFFGAHAAGGNGFIAAFVAGLVYGRHRRGTLAEGAELAETLGTLLSVFVWTLFGANLMPLAMEVTRDWRPIAYAIISLTLVRMIPVAISLIGTKLRRDTVVLMGWLGPRGLASVVFTLMAFLELKEARSLDATLLAAATWTIFFSVLAHGVTAGPLANWYSGRLARADGPLEEEREVEELPERVGF